MSTVASSGSLAERRDDLRAALGEARDDLAFGAQRFLVGVGGCDLEVGAAEEAMAGGRAAGVEAERAHRHDVVAMQREQPVRGTDELLVVVVAAGARIAHHFGDRQLRDRFIERVLQPAFERLPFREAARDKRSRPFRRTARRHVGPSAVRHRVKCRGRQMSASRRQASSSRLPYVPAARREPPSRA